jgi:UrcA family protein
MFNTFNTRLAALAVVAAAAAAAICGPAIAQPAEAPMSVTVGYADLNLNSAGGARILLHRIQTAADQSCGGAPDIHALSLRTGFDHCRNDAVGQAVIRVNAPMLSAAAKGAEAPVVLAGR